MARTGAPSAHLRVTGGEAGGRRLGAPRGIRPTAAMVKEAIFNLVGPAVRDAVVLDLFAGSGALGIEALSRGAARSLFIDRDDESVRVVRRNLAALGLSDRGRAIKAEVTRWLAGHADDVREATLVLVDPPYNDPVLEHALALLDTLVGGDTTVIAEYAHRQPLPALHRLQPARQRRYGDTAVSVLLPT